MANNTQLNNGTGGDVIATDDISGVKHQLVKIEYGDEDSATQVSPTNPLPVTVGNFPATQAVSATALPLPANAAQETGGNLAAIAGKDFATQTTLALIKAKT